MSERSTKILSLQGLRTLAFIGIFTEHAGLTHLGSWGVSCFLVLSGFLMYYNYGMSGGVLLGCNSVKGNIVFAVRKVKALYPLHCITLLTAMIVYWDNQKLDSARHILIWMFKLLANLFLLQSWLPKAEFYFSFNAVSWYLSTSIVLYFAFPYMQRAINRVKTKHGIMIRFIIVIAAQSAISALLLVRSDEIRNVPIIISDNLTKYVTYICPLYRMGDFYIGCLLGYVFCHNDFRISKNKIVVNVAEILSFAAIGLLQLIYIKKLGFLGTDAFKYTLLYTFDAMLLIYMVGLRKGAISKYILSSRLMVLIGDLAGYGFLIHQLFIVIVRMIFKVYIEQPAIMALLSFIITMVSAYAMMLLNTKTLVKKR